MLAQTITTSTGVTVTSVYMPEHAAAGQAALAAAAAAVETYAELFGAYPFSTFVQVEGDFYDGMEYSGLSFVGAGYYAEYDGTPNNLLTIISAHEVAHQWWHTLVGNDQAYEPWLDEALCTYAELLFVERRHRDSVPWWWAFRIEWYGPEGSVGSTIYDHTDFRGYVDSVYLNGAVMLHAMRQSLGDDAFLAFLRAYAAGNAGAIATAADFWAAYTAAGGDPVAVQAKYFVGP
jgi:aminopeptidase N